MDLFLEIYPTNVGELVSQLDSIAVYGTPKDRHLFDYEIEGVVTIDHEKKKVTLSTHE